MEHFRGEGSATVTGGNDELLTPGEVADRFGVNPKTVARWADAGKLHPIRTLGGHRRYRASEIANLLEQHSPDDSNDVDTNRP